MNARERSSRIWGVRDVLVQVEEEGVWEMEVKQNTVYAKEKKANHSYWGQESKKKKIELVNEDVISKGREGGGQG